MALLTLGEKEAALEAGQQEKMGPPV
jgi:hypothetical protein